MHFLHDERNNLHLDTVKSVLISETHYKGVSCSEFFDIISKDQNHLEKIYSTSEFKCDARESSGERERTFIRAGQPSTSHWQEGEEICRSVITESGLGQERVRNRYVQKKQKVN
jgi:hypothetical protein